MRISVAGSNLAALKMLRQRGFTLLELLVVLSIAALLAVGASLALPSSAQRHLEQESQRMVALLEIARAQSRSSGQAVHVVISDQGMQFNGMQSAQKLSGPWIYPETTVADLQLVLGPEPVIEAQAVQIFGVQGASQIIATDGVRPFAVRSSP